MKSKVSESMLLGNAVLGQLLHAEVSFLQQQNLLLKSTCSELAFQYSLTQTRLQVRTAELAKLRRPGEAGGKKVQGLRKRTEKLEKEGERLRERAKSLGKGLHLQGEIAQAKELQRLYTEKLEELRERWPGESAEKLKQTQEELQTASKERDYLRTTVVPVLSQTLALFEQHKCNLLSEITGLSTRLGTSGLQKSSWSSAKAAKGSMYAPSFLRTRRPALRVKSRREVPTSQPVAELDEFAEAFPEEDELGPCE